LELTQNGAGNDAGIPDAINQQIADRVDPALGPAGSQPFSLLVIWLDPRSYSLESPENGIFSNLPGAAENSLAQTFVYAAGSIDLVVAPLFPGTTYKLVVAGVSPTVRGAGIRLDGNGYQTTDLTTAAMRAGQSEFYFGSAGISLNRDPPALQTLAPTSAAAYDDASLPAAAASTAATDVAFISFLQAALASTAATDVALISFLPASEAGTAVAPALLLDYELAQDGAGKDADIPDTMNEQIACCVDPALGPAGSQPFSLLAIWPRSSSLESPESGVSASVFKREPPSPQAPAQKSAAAYEDTFPTAPASTAATDVALISILPAAEADTAKAPAPAAPAPSTEPAPRQPSPIPPKPPHPPISQTSHGLHDFVVWVFELFGGIV
jgi:hypothetical protein